MANEQNLIPNSKRTPSELREIARKGGIASGASRRAKKSFRELFEELMEKDAGVLDGEPITRKMAAAVRAANYMADSKTSPREFFMALEFIRDTIGEKPIEKVMVTEVDQDTIDEVERMVLGDD